jgi:mannose-6-phosphate isomerase
MKLYPLQFHPRFVAKMWGGRELSRVAHKSLPEAKPIGESWELFDFPPGAVGPDGRIASDRPDDWISASIANGPLAGMTLHEMMGGHRRDLIGGASAVQTPHGEQFPLLIKFLDARQDLSVQVHPPERYAATHPNAHLKNECWFILDHEPGARNLIGTIPGTSPEAFKQAIEAGACEAMLNRVEVKRGEMYYLPSGTVHALGAGIVAAEVQTPSDTTYRVFDFSRIEPSTGKPRTLHVKEALECIEFNTDWRSGFSPAGEEDRVLVNAPQFTVARRKLDANVKQRVDAGRMRVIMLIEGSLEITGDFGVVNNVRVSSGQTVLIPAVVEGSIVATQTSRYLEVRLPEA